MPSIVMIEESKQIKIRGCINAYKNKIKIRTVDEDYCHAWSSAFVDVLVRTFAKIVDFVDEILPRTCHFAVAFFVNEVIMTTSC